MQARVAREGEVWVIHLSGRLDVETAEPFRKACLNHLHGKKVVFDFRMLSFVGSSGILPFLETMQEYAGKNADAFKFSGVGPEFKKVFAATPLSAIEIFDSIPLAVGALLNPRPAMLAVDLVAAVVNAPAQAITAAPLIENESEEDAGEEKVHADYGYLSLKHERPTAEPSAPDEDL